MSDLILILQKTLIYAIPLLIVALGGCFSERSGIINLSLEAEMIFGAFCGALFVRIVQPNSLASAEGLQLFFTNHQQIMFICAMVIAAIFGALFSWLLAFAAVKFKADQTIVGTALNLFAPAVFLTFCLVVFQQEKVNMKQVPMYVIKHENLPGILRIFFDKAYISTFICLGLFIVLSIWLYKSKTGIHLRACGEHPQAADSVGINVAKMRTMGTLISGALAGIGGYAYIATCAAGTAESSIGGMGFLALAILIFGNWDPKGILLGSLLFGFLKCIGPIAPQIEFFKKLNIPSTVYNMIPYFIVIVVLIIGRKKSGCPKSEGIPYEKGQR